MVQWGEETTSHLTGNPHIYPIAFKDWFQIIGCMGRHLSSGTITPCHETLNGFCVAGELSSAVSFRWLALGGW